MIYVFDAGARVAYLRDEPGADTVEEVLQDAGNVCAVHAVNLCEVYYDGCRRDGVDVAKKVIENMLSRGLRLREDMDPEFWQTAGRIKATHKRVSLADCFAIAVARRLGAAILTTDHHEFDAVAQAQLCAVTFIR